MLKGLGCRGYEAGAQGSELTQLRSMRGAGGRDVRAVGQQPVAAVPTWARYGSMSSQLITPSPLMSPCVQVQGTSQSGAFGQPSLATNRSVSSNVTSPSQFMSPAANNESEQGVWRSLRSRFPRISTHKFCRRAPNSTHEFCGRALLEKG